MKLLKGLILTVLCIACLGAKTESNVHPHAKILGAMIYTDLSISLDGEEASVVLSHIRKELGVLMQVYWETKNVEGLDRSAPIFLTLENQPALVVLERIIEQMSDIEDATWQLRDGVLEIGWKSRFSKRRSQQIIAYPIDDLLFTVRDYDDAPGMGAGGGGVGGGGGGGGIGGGGGGGSGGSGGGGGTGGRGGGGVGFGTPGEDPDRLSRQEHIDKIIELITTFVEPEQWEQLGGECTIKNYREMLLVSAPDFVHRQIGGYPFKPVRPISIRLRRVNYTNANTDVRVDRRPIK